ncbi:unnamed protein product [Closterium sp. NIES-53]
MELNLWPPVSLPETSPTLRWTGEVGDTSVFRVWGSRAFVRDTSADKLSPRAIPCVFLGFVPDAPGWQFYHPTLRRVFPSQDVTFDESFPFYRLFPYRSSPPPPPPLFLAPSPPPVDPLPPQGPTPSGVPQVDPLPSPAPVQVAVGSGAARGAASGGVDSKGAENGGAEPRGVANGGGEPGGAEHEGVEPGGAASEGAESGGAEPQGAASSGASGAESAGAAGAGGTGVASGAGVTGVTTTTGPGGARTRGTGTAGTGGVEGARVGDLMESCATGAGGAGGGGAGFGGTGARGAGVGGPSQVLGTPSSSDLTPPLLCPPPDQSQPPSSRPVSPVRTARRVPCSRPPPVPGTHAMTLPRAASPTFSRLLATTVTDPSFESFAASALVAKLLDFAAACRLDYTTSLVAESTSAGSPSVGGECALGTDVLEDRQEDFECLPAAVPRFASMLLAPKRDPDAPHIPTPRSYAEAITGFRQRQGVDYFQTFSPIPKMTTFRVLLHVAAQRDYELHSLDFSTAFLQGCLHGFTESFPASTQWSLRRSVYGLRQAPREWHDILRTTLAALGFSASASSSPPHIPLLCLPANPSQLHLRTSPTSSMGLVLGGRGPVVLTGHTIASWVDDSATQRSSQGYTFSLGSDSVFWHSTRTSSVLSSSCEAEIYAGAMAAQELCWLTYLLTDLG